MKEKFSHYDIEESMPINDLLDILLTIRMQCPDAIITVRQCRGTDFPPFITIESKECRTETNESGEFVEQLC